MDITVGWFLVMAASSTLSLSLGLHLGRRGDWQTRCALVVGLFLLALWAYLVRRPVVAVHLIPIEVLSYIEGTAAVPIFMLIVGIAWGRSHLPRQRRAAKWAAILGVVYLLHGGLWMLQTTPAAGFADTVGGAIRQSQDYSCVPAACATALNTLGVYTSETEMACLTHTRPGTGATMIRAMNGLMQRLEGTPYTVDLVQPTYEQLMALPMPALTPLQFEMTRRHMVTLLAVTDNGVLLADPLEGTTTLPRDDFEQIYCGEVLVFGKR